MNVTIKCSKCSHNMEFEIVQLTKRLEADKDMIILCDCGNVILEDGKFVRQIKGDDSID